MKKAKKWIPLAILVSLLGLFFYFHLYQYLSFETLKTYRETLFAWKQDNFLLFLLIFAGIYILTYACYIPGAATFLAIVGGFVLGPFLGTVVITVSVTLGALIVYLAVHLALRDYVEKKASKWVKRLEKGFHDNAFSYLIMLRLLPFLPYWLVNMTAALLNIPQRIFLSATFLGVLPRILILTTIGYGLNELFVIEGLSDFKILSHPKMLLPLLGLVLLSFLPFIYRRVSSFLKKRRREKKHLS